MNRIAVMSSSLSSQTTKLRVVRGVVTGTGNSVKSVYVPSKGHGGRVTIWPELWVKEDSGQEGLYSGSIMGNARPGHEVAVMIAPKGREPVALANLSTDQVFLQGALDQDQPSGWLSAIVLAGLIGAIPLLIIYLMVGDAILPLFELFSSSRKEAMGNYWRTFPYALFAVAVTTAFVVIRTARGWMTRTLAAVDAELFGMGRSPDGSPLKKRTG